MVALLLYLIFAAAALLAAYAIAKGWFEARAAVIALVRSQWRDERRLLVPIYRTRPACSAQLPRQPF